MSVSRKGLKRYGFCGSYIVPGPAKTMIIDKENRRRWFVRPENRPRVPGGFFVTEFKFLREARRYAEKEAGLQ